MSEKSTTRNTRIDFLKFVGLSLIILAHVSPPYAVFQFRNFDVPLMVMAAGMAYAISRRNAHDFDYVNYVKNRAIRLVAPVWVFLSFYFLARFIIGSTEEINFRTIILSYLLVGGIGYVWIIRVFLFIAMISPVLNYITNRFSPRWLTALCLMTLVFIEAWAALTVDSKHAGLKLFELSVIFTAGYSVCFIVGTKLITITTRSTFILGSCAAVVFFTSSIAQHLIYGTWFDLQATKYPPRVFYLSYAIFMASLLWIISPRAITIIQKLHLAPAFNFIAQNTIWIYLWHIAFLDIVFFDSYIEKYVVVYILSTIFTAIQVLIIQQTVAQQCIGQKPKQLLKKILTG